jgi:hypothetical protein
MKIQFTTSPLCQILFFRTDSINGFAAWTSVTFSTNFKNLLIDHSQTECLWFFIQFLFSSKIINIIYVFFKVPVQGCFLQSEYLSFTEGDTLSRSHVVWSAHLILGHSTALFHFLFFCFNTLEVLNEIVDWKKSRILLDNPTWIKMNSFWIQADSSCFLYFFPLWKTCAFLFTETTNQFTGNAVHLTGNWRS